MICVRIESREKSTVKIKSQIHDIDLTERVIFTGRLFQRQML